MNDRLLPVGIQSFETIRTQGYLYVDKTACLHKLVKSHTPFFLSRPRRFGKSLLVSTMQAFFEGRKELFEGLAIDKVVKEWVKHPVFKFDLSCAKYSNVENLHYALNSLLSGYEREFGICDNSTAYGGRLNNLINKAYLTTGKKVVVLIDEYDAPMLDAIGNNEAQMVIRNLMRDFFSPLKSQSDFLRFVFLTGISKFSQLSIFSELNNLMNISLDDDFSDICGISKNEMRTYLRPEIEALASANGETFEQACDHLRIQYDGYHFSANGEDIFNPFSIVKTLYSKRYSDYWFASGTPTFLLDLMQKQNVEFSDLHDLYLNESDFDAPTDSNPDIMAVLYQSGYLTIKGYDTTTGLYKLDFPNNEVKNGFADFLLKHYAPNTTLDRRNLTIAFTSLLGKNDVDGFLNAMKDFLYTFPYNLGSNCREKHYQTILYSILATLGLNVEAEVTTANGRIDMTVFFKDRIFIFEFKLNKSAEEALQQINENGYANRFLTDGRPITKIGVSFSTETRNIEQWAVNAI